MQNDDIQNAFFTLLRSGLWNLPVTQTELFNQQTNWNAILTLAQKQTVTGWVADAIFRLPEGCRPEKAILLKLVGQVSLIARRHAVINNAAAHVVTLLEAEGIHPVLLKGQGVAALYHNPTLRMCGDIDLYVGRKDYTRSCQLLIKLVNKDVEYSESIKHFHIELNGVIVELHRITEQLYNPLQNKKFQRWSEEHLLSDKTATLELDGKIIHTPAPDFNAVYVFNHLWHHFLSSGVGLRQLCDWTMALHNQPMPLNKEKLKIQLNDFGLLDAWRTFGCIVVDELGLREDEFPLYDKSRHAKATPILNRILKEGNFGKSLHLYENKPKGIIAGKLYSLRYVSRRAASMAKVSPLNAAEYYLHFLKHGFTALPKALMGVRISYMDKKS